MTMSMISIPQDLLADLIQVASWYQSVCNGMIAGETIENHPDLDAFFYLKQQAAAIESTAKMYQNGYDPAPTEPAGHGDVHTEFMF